PHLATDVIVGFPGDPEEEFAESRDLIEAMRCANIHQFIYSPRPGTAAEKLPGRIPEIVARERAARLRAVARQSAEAFRTGEIGRRFGVIFERDDGSLMRGWSDHYLEVAAPSGMFPRGRIVEVLATESNLSPVGDLRK
ncbi:MAG: hypothetical protein MJ016_08140, partial [Victivallaceae bacterium]|nr:hypothetical protein [Victivallaceae bacterium]